MSCPHNIRWCAGPKGHGNKCLECAKPQPSTSSSSPSSSSSSPPIPLAPPLKGPHWPLPSPTPLQSISVPRLFHAASSAVPSIAVPSIAAPSNAAPSISISSAPVRSIPIPALSPRSSSPPLRFASQSSPRMPISSSSISSGLTSSPTSSASPAPGQPSAARVRRGSFLGEGSYKKVYKVEGDTGKVLVVMKLADRMRLVAERRYLAIIGATGVRVVHVFGDVEDLGDDLVGLLMEKLPGMEIKERGFSMGSAKQAFADAARAFGFAPLIRQLKAVQAYMKLHRGIGDLQFFVSREEGCVLFDPLNSGGGDLLGEIERMIRFLESPATEGGSAGKESKEKEQKDKK